MLQAKHFSEIQQLPSHRVLEVDNADSEGIRMEGKRTGRARAQVVRHHRLLAIMMDFRRCSLCLQLVALDLELLDGLLNRPVLLRLVDTRPWCK